MNSIDRLTELFKSFPGIGPRQAKRFVYYILSRNGGYSDELIRAIENLRKEIVQCQSCLKHFVKNDFTSGLCAICADESRDPTLLMIVPRDVDLEAVEKSGGYNGRYFVLGGVVPLLDKEPEKRIRIRELEERIKKGFESGLSEIILAMNANLDGEHTAQYIKEKFVETPVTFSMLGRGLSTGAELEYADPETLKNALKNRSRE